MAEPDEQVGTRAPCRLESSRPVGHTIQYVQAGGRTVDLSRDGRQSYRATQRWGELLQCYVEPMQCWPIG